MTEIEEKDILVLTDDIRRHSGFAVNGRLVTHALSQEYDVANASPQAQFAATTEVRGDTLDIYPAPSGSDEMNMGKEGMIQLLKLCDPDYVVSLVDVQMAGYLSSLRVPQSMSVPIRTAGSRVNKKVVLKNVKDTLQSRSFSPEFTWVAQVPIDGEPIPDDQGRFFKELDHTIAMSKFGKRTIEDTFPEIDAEIIPHAVDYREVDEYGDDFFLVGTVNKNQFRKQYPRLIEAFAKFYHKVNRPDSVRLYLHCDYQDSAGWDLNRFLAMHDVAGAIVPYKGDVDRETLMKLYNSFDIFASATAGEGFGLTTVEAMSQECPVILTDYTTSEELVMGGEPSPRGSLVDPVTMYNAVPRFSELTRALVDTDKLADQMYEYYMDPDRVEQEGKNAKEWVLNELSWEKVSEKWIDFFRSIE